MNTRHLSDNMGTLSGFPCPPATLRCRQSRQAPHVILLLSGFLAFAPASCGNTDSSGGAGGAKGGSGGSGGSGGKSGKGGAGGSAGAVGAGGSAAGGSEAGGMGGSSSGGSGSGGSADQGGSGAGGTSSGEGGRTGSAGRTGRVTGGTAAGGSSNGGRTGRGGSGAAGSEAGGSGGDGGGGEAGSTGAGGSTSAATCSITIKTKSLSTKIPTVGIVEWSTDLAGMTEASIEFGIDTQYGMIAPVDLKEPSYRTLILGMKAGGKTYHFRVVAKAGDKVCTGEDNTLPATGEPPTSLPKLSFTPANPTGADKGFLVLETFKQSFGAGGGDGVAYIVDSDGDFVWWYPIKGAIDLSRAKQSYDGKYMWVTTVNVMANSATMIRVKMDGTDEQNLSKDFAGINHDFAVRSDETVAFIAYGSNQCDDIKERSPSGTVTTIINSGSAVGASMCHCNAIQYDRNDDTIVFSELDTSSIVKVSRDTKQVVWVMSSQSSKATVTGINWKNQHNFHIIDDTHLLFFNNNTGPNSTAIEALLTISGGKGTAKQSWSYASNVTVQYMGDVQRLENGNTLITFSTAGEIREVSPSGSVVQTIKVSGSGNLFGFAEKRKSLYGPPPR